MNISAFNFIYIGVLFLDFHKKYSAAFLHELDKNVGENTTMYHLPLFRNDLLST